MKKLHNKWVFRRRNEITLLARKEFCRIGGKLDSKKKYKSQAKLRTFSMSLYFEYKGGAASKLVLIDYIIWQKYTI